MPFPDPTYRQTKDDCFRVALAYHADMHPKRVPYFKPGAKSGYMEKTFWELYQGWCVTRLWKYMNFLSKKRCDNEAEEWGQWVAIVGDKRGIESHAVVMDGLSLEYDPAQYRSRRPRKIYYGFYLEDYDYKQPVRLTPEGYVC